GVAPVTVTADLPNPLPGRARTPYIDPRWQRDPPSCEATGHDRDPPSRTAHPTPPPPPGWGRRSFSDTLRRVPATSAGALTLLGGVARLEVGHLAQPQQAFLAHGRLDRTQHQADVVRTGVEQGDPSAD